MAQLFSYPRRSVGPCSGPLLACFFLLLSIISGADTAHAQTVFRVGLRAGGNLSGGVGADADGGNPRFAYHAGVAGQLTLGQRWSVHPEALFSVKGDQNTTYRPSIGAQLSYVEVPLLLRYTLDDAYFEVGPHASYLLMSSLNDTTLRPLTTTAYNNLDYGVVVGLGFQDPGGFSVGWRYVAGLANVLRPDFPNAGEQVRLRNGTLQFSLGYRFNNFSGLKKLNPFRRKAKTPAVGS